MTNPKARGTRRGPFSCACSRNAPVAAQSVTDSTPYVDQCQDA